MKQVTEEQKKLLVEMEFSEDQISQLEGLRKEIDPDLKEKEEVLPEAPKVEAKSNSEPDSIEEKDSPLRDEVATALTDLAGSVKALSDIVTVIKTDVDTLKQSDESKIAEKTQDTPRASLADLVRMSVIGEDSPARIDGRTTLAKDGPQETEPDLPTISGISFIDDMIHGKDWRDSLGGSNGKDS